MRELPKLRNKHLANSCASPKPRKYLHKKSARTVSDQETVGFYKAVIAVVTVIHSGNFLWRAKLIFSVFFIGIALVLQEGVVIVFAMLHH